jgi:FKBP-type peptidyl-prolyl cis-trans isomerase
MAHILKIKWIIATGFISVLLLSSCLKDPNEEYEAEEQAKIDAYIKNKDFTKLECGIYLKFHHNNTETDDTTPKKGQTIVIDFTGEYTDGTVFETSVDSIGEADFPNLYFVYGPHRVRMGSTMYGLDTAMKFFSVGDFGTIVIPSKYASYDYVPRVYHVKLLEIIENDTTKEELQFSDFLTKKGFNEADTFQNGLYWKMISGTNGILNPDTIELGNEDSVTFNLIARYAEIYYGDSLGRKFYPLQTAPLKVKRAFEGSYYFPFVPAIDTALKHMNKGDIVEIAAYSNFAYYSSGFNDPYYGLTIVPPFMPVHYSIELLEIHDN